MKRYRHSKKLLLNHVSNFIHFRLFYDFHHLILFTLGYFMVSSLIFIHFRLFYGFIT
jgi:hypothetical protein